METTKQAGNVARTMQHIVKGLDPLRPVTYAAPVSNVFDGINGVIEVCGWNYRMGHGMDDYHAEHPNHPNLGTEQGSTVSTRGIYENDPQRDYVSAYDVNTTSWSNTAEDWYSFFAERPWLSGGFVWTGFDYRGEPMPYGWPCINSHFGILDTCGFPKDNFYYYRSWWTTNTVLHLLPHWNWPGRDGQEIRVDALSNCHGIELFLNGRSLGRQTMKKNAKLTWTVKYEPGTLSARGFDASGKQIATAKVETTGKPVAVKLVQDLTGVSKSVKADGEDLAIFTVCAVDAQGREVPTAQNKIKFKIEGEGRIIGVGNGDPSCHEPDVFLPPEARIVPVNGWHWKLGSFPTTKGETSPELAVDFDDSDWNTFKTKTKTDADISDMPLKPDETGIYRALIRLTTEDLDAPGVLVRFADADDQGWYFVNGQLVGESHSWQDSPVFDIKSYLHPGDNIIVVGVKNDYGPGGLNTDVSLAISPMAFSTPPWSRSLFNGLAQIIVQSSQPPRRDQTHRRRGWIEAGYGNPADAEGPAPAIGSLTRRVPPCGIFAI